MAVNQIAERLARDTEHFGPFGHAEFQSIQAIFLDDLSRMRRVVHLHVSPSFRLVVIDQVNIASLAVFKSENDPPVTGNAYRPEALEIAFQGIKPPARQTQTLRSRGGIQQGENTANSRHLISLEIASVSALVQLPPTAMPKAYRHRPERMVSIAACQYSRKLVQFSVVTTTTFNIAVLPGDGIGVDVTSEALKVLDAAAAKLSGVRFAFHQYSAGAAEYLKNGNPLPDEILEACRQADAVLLGAMGLPNVRWPDGKEMTPQIDLREKLDLYCGVRPIRLYHEADTPLKRFKAGEIDLVIVRESTEGLFSRRGSTTEAVEDAVTDVMRITRRGAERVCRAAFEIAQKRRKQLTLVDKANVLPSMVFFRSLFDNVSRGFPDVKAGHVYVDACALYLLQRPQTFDVLVTENMFGDILSDLAAGLIGNGTLGRSWRRLRRVPAESRHRAGHRR